MTLTSELTKVSYNGNDSTTAFAITFVFYADTGIRAIITVDSTGVETVQVDGVDFNLTGGLGLTGTLTMVTPPATGETLTIKSDIDDTQETELPIGGKFPSQAVEQRFDIITRLIQQKEEIAGRTILLKESTDLSDIEFPSPGALGFIRWDAAGTALETVIGISGGTFIEDADSDTKIQVEESADEDVIRFDIAGTEFAGMSTTNFVFANAISLLFVNNAGSSAANYGLTSDASDNLTLMVQAAGDIMSFTWAGTQQAKFVLENSGLGLYFDGESSSDHSAPSANDGVLYTKDDGSGNTDLFYRNASEIIDISSALGEDGVIPLILALS